jgi:6-phosphogluconate dehydrogenase
MVHNGIEYGLMAAYAEGLNVLKHANVGAAERETDAETTPLRDPRFYRYDLDLAEIAEVWRRGSVVGSWLLDLPRRPTRGAGPRGLRAACPTRARAWTCSPP